MDKLALYRHRDTFSLYEASCLMAGVTPNSLVYGIGGLVQKGVSEQREYLIFLRYNSGYFRFVDDACIPVPADCKHEEVDTMVVESRAIKELLQNMSVNDSFFNPLQDVVSFNCDQEKTEANNTSNKKHLSPLEKRLLAFNFWLAGQKYQPDRDDNTKLFIDDMTKNEVWDVLHKIDSNCFNANKNDFFKEQKLATFKDGRPRKK